ncbi:YtxH domain-containing protein [Pontibacter fetidus]|uniref:YtxH domain-containing protein n=1 Tax=Pontibacter fetidus TaxID=2700082 RepID=A0A6B2H5L6_9BACT|nr:YtxH domain-containing protein [Pontibacter fetidus]NDK55090.1 YtxH domain-containing protein [Pontibacter fetidus]
MKTTMECRSLGESKTNYTNANVRQMRQTDTPATAYGSTTQQKPTYQTRSTKEQKGISGGKIAAGVIAGASVGVLAGILLAPEKGKDLRKQVANSASRIGYKVSKSFNSTKDKVTSWTDKNNKTTGSNYNNLTSQSSSEVNTMYNDPTLGPTGGTNMQRCL